MSFQSTFPVMQCASELNLSEKEQRYVRDVAAHAGDLPVGLSKRQLRTYLYNEVVSREYPALSGTIVFWFTIGRIIWAIVCWYIDREKE